MEPFAVLMFRSEWGISLVYIDGFFFRSVAKAQKRVKYSLSKN